MRNYEYLICMYVLTYGFGLVVFEAEELREESKCPKLSTKDPRETIKTLSGLVEQHVIARKTGQNLTRVVAHGQILQ